MYWESVASGVVLPTGRTSLQWDVGDTGRVLFFSSNTDYEDSRFRGWIEFVQAAQGLGIEDPVIGRYPIYAKCEVVESSYWDSSLDFRITFPEETLPFAGTVFEVFRERNGDPP